VCRRCGSSIELDDPTMEAWAHDLASAHGYSDVSHTIEIFGVCAKCAKAAARG
jgi:Fur family ferric uptake transcriptional regulator